jgi:hypothetical protein
VNTLWNDFFATAGEDIDLDQFRVAVRELTASGRLASSRLDLNQ